MRKCTMCNKPYPEPILKKMVQIIERKAYLHDICPTCLVVAHNNPNYYYLAETKSRVSKQD